MAEGFPLVGELNEIRSHLFRDSIRYDSSPTSKVCNWLGHKAVTTVALPVNIASMGVSIAGTALSACTLGALKVAVFALTLGNVKLGFSTGCAYLVGCGFNSTSEVVENVGEVFSSIGDLVEQGYRFVVWLGEKTGLHYIVDRVFERIKAFCNFIGDRIGKGIDKAIQTEPNFVELLPEPLHSLNRLSGSYDDCYQEPSLGWVAQHAFASVAAFPVNCAAVIVGLAASILSSTAFTAKVILYAATNINIPIPTYAGRMMWITSCSTVEGIMDVGGLIADSGMVLYKASNALGVTKVVVTALEVLAYIPEAIFG